MGLSSLEQKSLDVAPPRTVYVKATIATSQRITIPAALIGKFVTFQAETSAVFIKFGTGAVTVSATAPSTGSPPAIAADATSGARIGPGEKLEVKLSSTDTDFAHISADANGFLRFWDSTGPGEG